MGSWPRSSGQGIEGDKENDNIMMKKPSLLILIRDEWI